MSMLRDLWQYRHFVLSAIRNELVSQFASSKLGGLWMVLNPLAQVAIYALILSNVLSAKLPGVEGQYVYAVYLMAGLLSWTLFNGIVGGCLNLFIEKGTLMKKISFPRITLPVILVGFNLLNNVLLFLAMVAIFVALGQAFSSTIIWLIPITLVTVAFGAGLGIILGVMNVFLRDIGHVVPIILQMWFWCTPIVYPAKIIPEKYHYLLELNPLFHLVGAYHAVLVYAQTPDLAGVGGVGSLALGLLGLGVFVFRRASEELVDAL